MFIDTHTHLYSKEFDRDRDALIEKAINSGVERFFLPNIDLESIEPMMALASRFPKNCYPMMGLHPCSVDANWQQTFATIEASLRTGSFVAVGEIGIDLYWDKTYIKEQTEVFVNQVELGIELNLPIVIHTRNSFAEVFSALQPYKGKTRGIFHCFSGDVEQARSILAFGGFKLGIGGVLTFKNSGLEQVIAQIGAEHLVLETDAPYLAPVPFRGKRNEPAYILEVARKLASICDLGIDEIESVTTRNAEAVFGVL